MITRNFENERLLAKWLKDKKDKCKSDSEFLEWLESRTSSGNKIQVNGKDYDLKSCMEILKAKKKAVK